MFVSATLNAKTTSLVAAPTRGVARRPARFVVSASGSRQEDKAKYVAKQDEKEARNPGGSAGGENTRDKKPATGAYGATNQGENPNEDQIQKSDHHQDALSDK